MVQLLFNIKSIKSNIRTNYNNNNFKNIFNNNNNFGNAFGYNNLLNYNNNYNDTYDNYYDNNNNNFKEINSNIDKNGVLLFRLCIKNNFQGIKKSFCYMGLWTYDSSRRLFL